ncbi:hypothetical protein SAY86_010467 [Trapa natans]|uniref:Exonuclease 1 n=1 Tax=Trapa natans TaxID=22666 RepID=A0AAN7R083_TRANT|nr:hypothetical protein SAY86_010467 [Trapa natans]
MGIQGLLPELKSIMQPIHIKELEGCSVAVDTYSWLHKGALSCCKELCKGLPTNRHVDYCMHKVNLLRHYGVKPILVFDGGFLPMKIEQENKRARSRKENLARAIEHELNGNSYASYEFYKKAVDISPSIAHQLIQVLKKENIYYVVAPYEADAQMTFLALTKQVDAVITEDSDLIPFGCPRIIYKMDKYGQGVEFRYSNLHQNRDMSFTGFSKQMVLEMCILSGCDYLQSMPGMGLKKAHQLIKKFKTYDKVIKHLKYNTTSVPPDYEEMFRKAVLTFHHQRVYDPLCETIVHLSDVPDHLDDDLDFLGPYPFFSFPNASLCISIFTLIPQHVAKRIAEGDLDPITKIPFQAEIVDSMLMIQNTCHSRVFMPEVKKKRLDLPAQKNLVTKYFCVASHEAKKEFKAPRNTLNNSSPDSDPSPTSNLHMAKGAADLNIDTSNNLSVYTNVNHDCLTVGAEISESSTLEKMETIITPGTSLLPQSKHTVHKPWMLLHNELHMNCSDGTKGKLEKENGKAVVRSRFFQHKSGKENNKDSADENLWADDAVYLKRKTCFEDGAQENSSAKRLHMENSLQRDGHSSLVHGTLPNEMKPEIKFGSNISHIDHYCDIAEQSLERFVSVISSFKYKGSGTRASGLRAPLREVKDTSKNRSNVPIDVSQFAYVPKGQKSGLVYQKI